MSEMPQIESEEDQLLVLVQPPTLPNIFGTPYKGVEVRERLQIFYTADTFVLDDPDTIDSFVLEVPYELLNLKEGVHASLPKYQRLSSDGSKLIVVILFPGLLLEISAPTIIKKEISSIQYEMKELCSKQHDISKIVKPEISDLPSKMVKALQQAQRLSSIFSLPGLLLNKYAPTFIKRTREEEREIGCKREPERERRWRREETGEPADPAGTGRCSTTTDQQRTTAGGVAGGWRSGAWLVAAAVHRRQRWRGGRSRRVSATAVNDGCSWCGRRHCSSGGRPGRQRSATAERLADARTALVATRRDAGEGRQRQAAAPATAARQR
ncbi:hypothetical protein Scep_014361 [Stephania cephalantha]|uniref:Uncharacterized protein n=1 Tax=Stephania cephalantha TaxID=152367 RepID=A0AAP0P1L4_9MAGN